MAFSDIEKILEKPDQPKWVPDDESQWDNIEMQLGTTLPRDYKRFITNYGDGVIGSSIIIYSPFSPLYGQNLFDQIRMMNEILKPTADKFRIDNPERFFPEANGLFPVGHNGNGDSIYWRTSPQDDWKIEIRETRSIDTQKYDGDFSGFICSLLDGSISQYPEISSMFQVSKTFHVEEVDIQLNLRTALKRMRDETLVPEISERDVFINLKKVGLYPEHPIISEHLHALSSEGSFVILGHDDVFLKFEMFESPGGW